MVQKKDMRQTDHYFKKKGYEHEFYCLGSFIVRLRLSDGKSVMTYKAMTCDPGVWDEYEFKVGNEVKKMIMFMDDIGFKKICTLEKHRIEFNMKDDMKIILDDIKGLGYFIECEILCKTNNPKDIRDARERINTFIMYLDLKRYQIESRGYLELLYEQNGNRWK
jgi:predicted adenylyl cyclase CyaB